MAQPLLCTARGVPNGDKRVVRGMGLWIGAGAVWLAGCGACAGQTELLESLPDHAAPGACYAHVKVGGHWVSPPVVAEAHWSSAAPWPGSVGPVWCLTPVAAKPPVWQPERYGWIEVLCDKDITPARIARLKSALAARGYYRGKLDGRMDETTAEAVTRFQTDQHIDHGGFLSMTTIRALEGTSPPVAPQVGYDVAAAQAHAYNQAFKELYRPQPALAMAYAAPAPSFAARADYPSAVQNGRLTWTGKVER